ncbi:threonyl-tRNA synthetase [Dimargaris cristalligena]|uniref:threonine--tRNA ligase n=1 Tax=Dimargaris cristalligena TaxID=215637 RepID=A0A4P9ZMS7_9FUNG|nr:threonyl-tRNA synthetase [Dimargaris cristalligena]|eukprot:RKP34388.1 threonyl-tRNA synthetase [Dimargaris cristalligena]
MRPVVLTLGTHSSFWGRPLTSGSFRGCLRPRTTTASRFVSYKYLDQRLRFWEAERRRQNALEIPADSPHIEITCQPWGIVQSGKAGVTTPQHLTSSLPKSVSRRALVARKDGDQLWDMNRPLPESTQLEYFAWSGQMSPDNVPSASLEPAKEAGMSNQPNADVGQGVFWHTSAHLLGATVELLYGDRALLCNGPALPGKGFYYDFLLLKSAQVLSAPDRDQLETTLRNMLATPMSIERMVVSRALAFQIFAYNPFKCHYITRIPDDHSVSLYKCGSFIDLCQGPHLKSTDPIRLIQVTKMTGAHWMPARPSPPPSGLDPVDSPTPVDIPTNIPFLNRVYGISFPNAEQHDKWQHSQELALQRDHRAIGKAQHLFSFDTKLSPGSVFLLPHGTRIAQRIFTMLRAHYRQFGFDEVMTPLIYKKELWETSGHWQNYADDMFIAHAPADPDIFGLKPMNCPGHCLIFAERPRSHNELPLRLADFSPLHRNEASGALAGLTRVRKFHQDDGHIFCTPEQVFAEISQCLSFMDRIYGLFRFQDYELTLSTRPESNYMGSIEDWSRAEAALTEALNKTGRPWTLKPGDGAFYGPKIDIMVRDALDRTHQTATIQLDFQLPQRFQLRYMGADGALHSPVIIHRAILGSLERMLAILIEHYAGKWPFWLSPRQAKIVPRAAPWDTLAEDFYFVDLDSSKVHSMGKTIREAQLAQYNFILVVGEKEVDTQTVNVRTRSGEMLGTLTIPEVIQLFRTAQAQFG